MARDQPMQDRQSRNAVQPMVLCRRVFRIDSEQAQTYQFSPQFQPRVWPTAVGGLCSHAVERVYPALAKGFVFNLSGKCAQRL